MNRLDVKSMLVGFLLCICSILMMGLNRYQAFDIPYGYKVYAEDIAIMNCNKKKHNDCTQWDLDFYLKSKFNKLDELYKDWEVAESRSAWLEKDIQMRLNLLELNAGLRDVDDWPGKELGVMKPDYWPTNK